MMLLSVDPQLALSLVGVAVGCFIAARFAVKSWLTWIGRMIRFGILCGAALHDYHHGVHKAKLTLTVLVFGRSMCRSLLPLLSRRLFVDDAGKQSATGWRSSMNDID